MISGRCVSGIFEVVGALLWREGCEQPADLGTHGVDGAGSTFALQMLVLGEDLLDRVEIRGVFGQEEKLGAG